MFCELKVCNVALHYNVSLSFRLLVCKRSVSLKILIFLVYINLLGLDFLNLKKII